MITLCSEKKKNTSDLLIKNKNFPISPILSSYGIIQYMALYTFL